MFIIEEFEVYHGGVFNTDKTDYTGARTHWTATHTGTWTGLIPCHICAGTGLIPSHICTGTAPATTPGLGSPPSDISAGTGLEVTPPTSAPGPTPSRNNPCKQRAARNYLHAKQHRWTGAPAHTS